MFQPTNKILRRQTLTRQTAHTLLKIGEQEVRTTPVLYTARLIVRRLYARDDINDALACLWFVRHNVKYQRDPRDIELVFGPVEMIRLIKYHGGFSEDCDSKALLVYALVRALGIRARLVCAGFTPGSDRLDHVFTQIYYEGKHPFSYNGLWLTLDPTLDPRFTNYMCQKAQWIEFFDPETY